MGNCDSVPTIVANDDGEGDGSDDEREGDAANDGRIHSERGLFEADERLLTYTFSGRVLPR